MINKYPSLYGSFKFFSHASLVFLTESAGSDEVSSFSKPGCLPESADSDEVSSFSRPGCLPEDDRLPSEVGKDDRPSSGADETGAGDTCVGGPEFEKSSEAQGRLGGSNTTGSASPVEKGGLVFRWAEKWTEKFWNNIPDSTGGHAAGDLVNSVKSSASSMTARVRIACLPAAIVYSFFQVLVTQILRVASNRFGEKTMSAVSFSTLGVVTSLRYFCGPLGLLILGRDFFLFSGVVSAFALFQLSTVRSSWFRGGPVFMGILSILSPFSSEKVLPFLPGVASWLGEIVSSYCPLLSFAPMGALLSFAAKGLFAYRLSRWMEIVSGANNPDRDMWVSRDGCCSAFEILWKSVPLFVFSLICVPFGLCWPSLFGYFASKEVELSDYEEFRPISVSYPKLMRVQEGEEVVVDSEESVNEEQGIAVHMQQKEPEEVKTGSNIVMNGLHSSQRELNMAVEEEVECVQEQAEEFEIRRESIEGIETENGPLIDPAMQMMTNVRTDVITGTMITGTDVQSMVDFTSEDDEPEDVNSSTDSVVEEREEGDFRPSSEGYKVSLDKAKRFTVACRVEGGREGSGTEGFFPVLPNVFQRGLFSPTTCGIGSPLRGRVYPLEPYGHQGSSKGILYQGAFSSNDLPSQGLPLSPPNCRPASHLLPVTRVRSAAAALRFSRMFLK